MLSHSQLQPSFSSTILKQFVDAINNFNPYIFISFDLLRFNHVRSKKYDFFTIRVEHSVILQFL
ncbi:hypothetical protein DK870_00235 [Pseudomonas sp. Q1]|nr:hypothetical protein [Pseudomonas sp. Q1]